MSNNFLRGWMYEATNSHRLKPGERLKMANSIQPCGSAEALDAKAPLGRFRTFEPALHEIDLAGRLVATGAPAAPGFTSFTMERVTVTADGGALRLMVIAERVSSGWSCTLFAVNGAPRDAHRAMRGGWVGRFFEAEVTATPHQTTGVPQGSEGPTPPTPPARRGSSARGS